MDSESFVSCEVIRFSEGGILKEVIHMFQSGFGPMSLVIHHWY